MANFLAYVDQTAFATASSRLPPKTKVPKMAVSRSEPTNLAKCKFANAKSFRYDALFHQAFQNHRRFPRSRPYSNASVQRPNSGKFEQVCLHVFPEKKSTHVFQPANDDRKRNRLNWLFAPRRKRGNKITAIYPR